MLDWLLCSAVKALGAILRWVPPEVCVPAGEALGRLAAWTQPKRVRIGERNLAAAFGDRLAPGEARRIVRRLFANFGAALIELLRMPAVDRAYVDRYIPVEGLEHVTRAQASGRPIMFLTGHFGNWELSSIVLALIGIPITALAREQDKFPRLYRLLISMRESKGCRIVHKGGAVKQLIRALDRREAVGIVGDQASRQGVAVEFFGRPALFATGPFELARSRGAIILPAFIHRVRGPHHRIVIEAPIDLTAVAGTPDAVVRAGLERFAAALAAHIAADPAQWLWMHKRWKHTTARRALILSDGKLGHVKQSQTVTRAMREESPGVTEQVIEVRYHHGLLRMAAAAWAWLAPKGWLAWPVLRAALAPDCFRTLAAAYADVLISCGSATAPVAVLLSGAWRIKSVVIMNPRPIPLSRFDLAFVPVHDDVRPQPHVVQVRGALNTLSAASLDVSRERLRSHPRFRPPMDRRASISAPTLPSEDAPVIAVLLGGDTEDYALTAAFVEQVIQQALAACEAADAVMFVTTSRRTPPDVEHQLEGWLADHPRCSLLLLASRDALEGTIEGMLGWSQAVVVTGESISMVSEASASGRPVVVVDPPRRRAGAGQTKAERFLQTLVTEGVVHHPAPAELGALLSTILASQPSVRRVDTYAAVRAAVRNVL